jgi:hypothetical protein
LLIGCSANVITHAVALPLGSVPLLASSITGATVAALVGNIWWSLVGVVLGACGTRIWGGMSNWAESTMNSSTFGRHEASALDSQLPRWEIDEPLFDRHQPPHAVG